MEITRVVLTLLQAAEAETVLRSDQILNFQHIHLGNPMFAHLQICPVFVVLMTLTHADLAELKQPEGATVSHHFPLGGKKAKSSAGFLVWLGFFSLGRQAMP